MKENALTQSLNDLAPNHIYPFFWQQGVESAVFMEELGKIYESGARGICVEARPHPDFTGPRWWQDMDQIMAYARDHGMEVWLLDDDHFPTGHANGTFAKGDHPLANRFLTIHSTDVLGPVKAGNMPVETFLPVDAKVIGVVACERVAEHSTELAIETCRDLSGRVQDGWLCWDVPSGLWRIMILYTTHEGNGKLDYFNILDSRSVHLLIERVYEPHYQRYQEDFGKTFRGFFSDEPEFANLPGYDFQAKLGNHMPFIPWSDELQQRLIARFGKNWLMKLPGLWYLCQGKEAHIRYGYMDEVTKQLTVSFSRQIGDWCDSRNVMHVGHIIEDDNAHGRLGCSTGHYFRSLSGMKMAGIDVVHLEIMPGMKQEIRQWMASDRDGEFFHYGLAKLGSSLAHIDEKKQGNTMCEIFGAYGWQEGISLMKWLVDHMIANGVNCFVPHAYSPKEFPDPDCPPHFYAGGNHPQFSFFSDLTRYMNRLSHLFSGGIYPARIAVLYHADAEWAGEAMLFQKPVRKLMEAQIACDIVPADLFAPENGYGMNFDDGKISVSKQQYDCLILPECEFLPQAVAEFSKKAAEQGFLMIFLERHPQGICEECDKEKEMVEGLKKFPIVKLGDLVSYIKGRSFLQIEIGNDWHDLRVWPYRKENMEYIFFFNESISQTVEDYVFLRGSYIEEKVFCYDAAENSLYEKTFERVEGGIKFLLELVPGESVVIVIGKLPDTVQRKKERKKPERWNVLEGRWQIKAKEALADQTIFLSECLGGQDFPDLTAWVRTNRFCGTIIYEIDFICENPEGETWMMRLQDGVDCAEVFVNRKTVCRMLGTPFVGKIGLAPGVNHIRIEIPLTPVWAVGDAWSALTMISGPGLRDKPEIARWNEE